MKYNFVLGLKGYSKKLTNSICMKLKRQITHYNHKLIKCNKNFIIKRIIIKSQKRPLKTIFNCNNSPKLVKMLHNIIRVNNV